MPIQTLFPCQPEECLVVKGKISATLHARIAAGYEPCRNVVMVMEIQQQVYTSCGFLTPPTWLSRHPSALLQSTIFAQVVILSFRFLSEECSLTCLQKKRRTRGC